jgi:uncharacterized protein (UPF0333 family)
MEANTLIFIGGVLSKYFLARPILLIQMIILSLFATHYLKQKMFSSVEISSSSITKNSALMTNSYKDKSTSRSFIKRGK